jgi:hypothetical protein
VLGPAFGVAGPDGAPAGSAGWPGPGPGELSAAGRGGSAATRGLGVLGGVGRLSGRGTGTAASARFPVIAVVARTCSGSSVPTAVSAAAAKRRDTTLVGGTLRSSLDLSDKSIPRGGTSPEGVTDRDRAYQHEDRSFPPSLGP